MALFIDGESNSDAYVKAVKQAQTIWLFDLDNTLHNASAAVFPAIAENMTRFMAEFLRDENGPLDLAAVNALRMDYLKRYGATMKGLVLHHGVREADFLREAHRFDDLPALLRYERGLAHVSIEAMRVHGKSHPKPSKAFLRQFLAQHGWHPRQCVLVEDSLANLSAAKQIGMRTVMVTGHGQHIPQKSVSARADITVKSVFELPRRCGRWRMR
ncbi:MAG: HAD-IA family hydrolase [Burkholderiales bacterium]|nr:HAD-IA family hydrolase [Burkholderiales bacterium]